MFTMPVFKSQRRLTLKDKALLKKTFKAMKRASRAARAARSSASAEGPSQAKLTLGEIRCEALALHAA
jgi:hypothetical protein